MNITPNTAAVFPNATVGAAPSENLVKAKKDFEQKLERVLKTNQEQKTNTVSKTNSKGNIYTKISGFFGLILKKISKLWEQTFFKKSPNSLEVILGNKVNPFTSSDASNPDNVKAQVDYFNQLANDKVTHPSQLKQIYKNLSPNVQKALGPFENFIDANTDFDLYKKYGAQYNTNLNSTRFGLFAPNAKGVKLRLYDDSEELIKEIDLKKDRTGDWKVNLLDIGPGQRYHYKILGADDKEQYRIDPYSLQQKASKKPGNTPYSIVTDRESYKWKDQTWIAKREKEYDQKKPLNFYEVYPSAWKRHDKTHAYNWKELAVDLVKHSKEHGYTHLELMGLADHPCDESMGYQVTGFFAPNNRLGSPEDFKWFVDHCHQNGIGVIMDWIPFHFANDSYGLHNFDGTPLYETAKESSWTHNWGTYAFDTSKPAGRNFLLSNAKYWVEEMHLDGLRVDAVHPLLIPVSDNGVPIEIPLVKKNSKKGPKSRHPIGKMFNRSITNYLRNNKVLSIAEDLSDFGKSTLPISEKGLGYDYRWTPLWTHLLRDYLGLPLNKREKNNYTIPAVVKNAQEPKTFIFLSHDELGGFARKALGEKTPGLTKSQKIANLKLMLSFLVTSPGAKLTFMGAEMGVSKDIRETLETTKELDWKEAQQEGNMAVSKMVKAVNNLYLQSPCLWDNQKAELLYEHHDDGVFAFKRKSENGQTFICIHNFSSNERNGYKVKVPTVQLNKLKEIFNSDSAEFSGSGITNPNPALQKDGNGNVTEININIPPLSTLIFSEI